MVQGLAAGLLQGYAKGKQQKRERSMQDIQAEREKEKFEIFKLTAQMKQKEMDRKTKMAELVANRLSEITQVKEADRQDRRDAITYALQKFEQTNPQNFPMQAQPQPQMQQGTPMGESMQQGQQGGMPADLLEMMALAGMESEARALQQIKRGRELPQEAADRLEESKQKRFQADEHHDELMALRRSEWKEIPVTTRGGGQQIYIQPKYGLGPVQGVIQGRPPSSDLPVTVDKVPFYINRETLKPATQRMSPNEYYKKGFMAVPPVMVPNLQKMRTAISILDEIGKRMEEVIPKKEFLGKIGGVVRSIDAWAQMTGKGQKLAVLRDYIDANKALFAKSLGEVGALSEVEQEAIKIGLGSISDAGPKAWDQYELMRMTFDGIKETILPSTKEQTKVKPDPLGLR